MSFFEKMLFGKELPEYSEEASFPSSTIKSGKCTKKHCTQSCLKPKNEIADWEYWANFLSEKEICRTVLLKKIKDLNNELRFSVWVKLIGARELHMNIKSSFKPKKSDRKVADMILRLCRDRSDSYVLDDKNIEMTLFEIYRNLLDIFSHEENEVIQEADIDFFVKSMKDSTEKNSHENKEGIQTDLKENKKQSTSLEILFDENYINIDLIYMIDYMMYMPFSNKKMVFKIIYILLERMRLGELYFSKNFDNNDLILKDINEDLAGFLNDLKFGFIRKFISLMIHKNPDAFNYLIDISLCFSSTSFIEIVNKIILDNVEELHRIASENGVIFRNKTEAQSESSEENNVEEESISNYQPSKTSKHDDSKENSTKMMFEEKKSHKSEAPIKSNKIVEIDSLRNKKNEQKKPENDQKNTNSMSVLSSKKIDNIDKINDKIAKVLFDYIKDDFKKRLNDYVFDLKPQKINLLQCQPFIENKEKYFDFLIIQDQIMLAQERMRLELCTKIKELQEENERLTKKETTKKF